MAYLSWIDDAYLKQIIKDVLTVGVNAKKDAAKKFTNNVIDPFAALFESAAFGLTHEQWVSAEMTRQSQKTLQNHIGDLHQNILGSVKNWQNLKVGSASGVDLENEALKIIAEIKNKYNTVTGGKLVTNYQELERQISPKSSKYFGYTAYFVNIIPKSASRFDKAFTPSNKDTGMRCATNEKIRIIDGAGFYELVTGSATALSDLYQILPIVIEDVYKTELNQPNFKIENKQAFIKHFTDAFGQ